MSVNNTPPISLWEIAANFGKLYRDETTGAYTRYVRDFAQKNYPRDGWDLLDYMGQSYGLQYKLRSNKFETHGSIYELPLDMSDKRIDGAITHVIDNDIDWDADGQRGKYFWLWIDQSRYDRTPGAVGLNGWWYAGDTGKDNKYRVKMTLETGDDWEDDAQVWGMVLGYRHGYLDGTRVNYAIFGHGENYPKNHKLECEAVFTVDKNYRHIVMNYTVFQPGGYGRNAYSYIVVSNVTVERVSDDEEVRSSVQATPIPAESQGIRREKPEGRTEVNEGQD